MQNLLSIFSPRKEVELLIYGMWPPMLLQSIPLAGPGFDVGITEVNREFAGALVMKRSFVSGKELLGCLDTSANVDQISQHYYNCRQNGSDRLFILIYLEWNILAFSGGATFSDQLNRVLYPTTLVTGPLDVGLYSVMMRELCEASNWDTIGLIFDTSSPVPFPLQIYQMFASNEIVLSGRLQLQQFPIQANSNLSDLLQKVSQVSRVTFLVGAPLLLRKIMIEALKQNKTFTDYAWIALELPDQALGPVTWQRNDTYDDVALEAFGSVKQMILCFDRDSEADRLLKQKIIRATEESYGYSYPPGRAPSEFATTGYLVAKMIAKVINDSVHQHLDIKNGQVLAQQFRNQTFTSGAIGGLFIDAAGKRQNKICLSSFDRSIRKFTRVLFHDHTQNGLQVVPKAAAQLWATSDNMAPPATPFCGFLGERCREHSTTIIVISTVIPAVIASVLLGFILLCHMHRHSHIHDLWWKLATQDLSIRNNRPR
ncbi:hypothetical protein BV898_16484 [Hypsibius exemplaris]|uniref:Receptor ligand binding region domain-containing protein n=1 Tax=Hypsibius exemplaris TaxID=2072580 RepID=A0A9X6NFZ2_HYPEX|nr:hypothetical protein BV898_16484 [Hypsibius exemplaris]